MRALTAHRFVAAGAVGGYWVLYELEAQRALTFAPAPVREFFHGDVSVVIGLGALFVLGLYIGSWWALAVAAAPLPFLAALELGGHIAPYNEAEAPLSAWPLLLLILASPVGLGVALRRVWRDGVTRSSRRATVG